MHGSMGDHSRIEYSVYDPLCPGFILYSYYILSSRAGYHAPALYKHVPALYLVRPTICRPALLLCFQGCELAEQKQTNQE
jgi:hypothetical protein